MDPPLEAPSIPHVDGANETGSRAHAPQTPPTERPYQQKSAEDPCNIPADSPASHQPQARIKPLSSNAPAQETLQSSRPHGQSHSNPKPFLDIFAGKNCPLQKAWEATSLLPSILHCTRHTTFSMTKLCTCSPSCVFPDS